MSYSRGGLEIEFRGHEEGKGYFYTYHDFHPEIVSEEDRTIRFPVTMSETPLSPELFAVWVRQSVNRAAQSLYGQTFAELMLAGSVGSMYCTKSELLADVLAMQIQSGNSIEASTTSTLMNVELPFLSDVELEKLMRVRTEEGDAFQNFRTELDRQLRDLRSIDDPEQASRKAKEVVHDLTEVQIRDINNKLLSLKEKLWFKAAFGTVGLLVAVYGNGAGLLATASAALEPVLEYRKEIKRHPAFFLWRVLKK